MAIVITIVTLIIVILQTVVSGAMLQEMVDVLDPTPFSPIKTSSGVKGSLQCTKDSDESYAVCASESNTVVKYNLQPFSFPAKGPDHGDYMRSCDLYDTSSQSTSRAVCVRGSPRFHSSGVCVQSKDRPSNDIVFFHRVSDMAVTATVTLRLAGQYPHVTVDARNQIAFVSNFYDPPAIYKITNIGSPSPIVAATLSSFGYDDTDPAAMLIIDGFLYVHLSMNPARLARISIATFTWAQTVEFEIGEYGGSNDNLANDDNFLYDLTRNGFLVRCTYKNNIFSRFDSLNTGFSSAVSLAISPDSSFLLFTASPAGIILVNTSTFSVESRALLPKPDHGPSWGYVDAVGRPIILSKNRVFAFSSDNDYLYAFQFARVPFRELYPTISPLPSSPIVTSSGVSGSLQCTKNSDESYAVCASESNTAIKYNLEPFSFAAKGPDQGFQMKSCDLYETDSQSTSRAVCVKETFLDSNVVVYFHKISDMINITNVTIRTRGEYHHVIVDAPNRIAYISNRGNPPVIFKLTNIGSSTPIAAGNLTSFGSGDSKPGAMLIIDGFLYVHLNMWPARMARIKISTSTWNQTVTFNDFERNGNHDILANDDNFIYFLTQFGFLVRCAYNNNNFSRFDSLETGYVHTCSLAISPDQRTLFVVTQFNGILQMVDVSSFSTFGNSVSVPGAFGRPIVTSSRHVYAFSEHSDLVFPFRYSDLEESSSSLTQKKKVSEFVELFGCTLFAILAHFFMN